MGRVEGQWEFLDPSFGYLYSKPHIYFCCMCIGSGLMEDYGIYKSIF